MKTLYFNKSTLMGERQTPVSLRLEVPDNFTLTKYVDVISHYDQKKDEQGRDLYLKDIFREEVTEVIVGYDETLEVTEKPLMETIHKTNENGDKLYLEVIIDEETGEEETFETVKQFDEYGGINEPILIEQQKVTTTGKPIYLKPIIEQVVESIFDHQEETIEITETPSLEPKYKSELKDVFEDRELFSINEVLQCRVEGIIEASEYEYIIADLFLDENDLDLEKSFANTGIGILQLPPSGYASTKSISLSTKAKTFKFISIDKLPEGISVYVNTKKVVEGQVALASPVSAITIKYSNTTNKYLDVKSFCIGYKEELV